MARHTGNGVRARSSLDGEPRDPSWHVQLHHRLRLLQRSPTLPEDRPYSASVSRYSALDRAAVCDEWRGDVHVYRLVEPESTPAEDRRCGDSSIRSDPAFFR